MAWTDPSAPWIDHDPATPLTAARYEATLASLAAYTDSLVEAAKQGLSVKQSAVAATTTALPTNIYNNGASGVGATLTGAAFGALEIDGVAVTAGERVLVKNEAEEKKNGVYTVTHAGAVAELYVLTRSTDMNSTGQFDGAFVFVDVGTVNGASGWTVASTTPIIVGTTSVVWTQFGAPAFEGNKLKESWLPPSVVSSSATPAAGQIYRATGTDRESEPIPKVFYPKLTAGTDCSAEIQAAMETAAESETGGRVILVGQCKASDLHIPPGVDVSGLGPGRLRTDYTKPVTQIEPAEAEVPIFTINELERVGLHDIGFFHDRSFEFDAVAIATTNFVRWLNNVRRITGLEINGSLLRVAGYTVWESVIEQVHGRGCGSASRAAIEVVELAGRDTNNLTFRDCRSIYPQGKGIRVISAANPEDSNYPGARVITLDGCMLHGGVNEENLTPYAADLIEIDGFSDFSLINSNLANAASGYRALSLSGSELTKPSNRAYIANNRIYGSIELTHCKDVEIGPNRWLQWAGTGGETPAEHIKINEGVLGTKIEPQTVLNSNEENGRIIITDNGTGTVVRDSSGKYKITSASTGLGRILPLLGTAQKGVARIRDEGGDVTVNANTFKPVMEYAGGTISVLDLVVRAQVGDTIEISVSGQWNNEAIAGRLDFATIVSSAPVHYVSSGGAAAATSGIIGMFGAASVFSPIGGTVTYVVQATDIAEDGTVTLRPYAKTDSGASKKLNRSATNVLFLTARNVR